MGIRGGKFEPSLYEISVNPSILFKFNLCNRDMLIKVLKKTPNDVFLTLSVYFLVRELFLYLFSALTAPL